MNKEDIVNKLFANQINNIDPKYRLNTKDIVRLSSYISSDPFSEHECCKWKGAISKSSHQSKYINFWFNKKKQALHRILYLNYVGELPKNKYLRFTCPNINMRGICCNINHLDLINKEDIDKDFDSTERIFKSDNIQMYGSELDSIGNTSKPKKNKKTKNSSTTDIYNKFQPTINSINNTYNSDIFVIVFED